jgi:FixJ family two-component response regulator
MSQQQSLVYVVDDDLSICRAMSLLLSSYGYAVKTFSRAEDFLATDHAKTVSCLVLDVNLPGLNGIALQETMAEQGLAIPIIFVTGHGNIPMSVKAMKAGAVDFLPKPFVDTELLAAIARAVAKNKMQNKDASEIAAINSRIKTLSPRELEVFCFVAAGMLNKQIAFKRGTSLQTIKVHRGRVMQKMQAKTVTELIGMAQKAAVALPLV